jgi:AcrR family transcriptional regulator
MPRPKTVSDEAILAATDRVIARAGPARLTLAAVAREAGLAPATLVQRFGSRRSLLLEFARGGAAAVRARFQAPARGMHPEALCSPARGTHLEALVDNLAALAAPVADPVAFSNHLSMLHQDLSDPEFHALARAYARAVQEEIETLLARAMEACELEPSVDVVQLARSVQTAYNGALITWAIAREGPLDPWLRRELQAVLAPWRC